MDRPPRQCALSLAILSFTFLSRLLWCVLAVSIGIAQPDKGDPIGYVALARALAGGSFSVPEVPDALRTPGYPLVLIPGVISHHLLAIALLENVLLATASAYLISRIAEHLWPNTNVGLWAMALFCCEPVSLFYTGLLLSETLFVTQFLVFVWAFLHFLHARNRAVLALSAMLLGATAYTRPISVYLGVLLIPLVAIITDYTPLRRRVLNACAFALVFALSLAPWIARNWNVYEYPSFSSSGPYNLYFMWAGGIEAAQTHRTLEQVTGEWGFNNEERYLTLHPDQRNWPKGKIYRYMAQQGALRIRRNLWLSFLLQIKGCAIVLFDPGRFLLSSIGLFPESDIHLRRMLDGRFLLSHKSASLLMVFMALQLYVYYLLAFRGSLMLNRGVLTFFLVIVVYFVLVSGLPFAEPRYRAPIMPLVCITAAGALCCRKPKKIPTISHFSSAANPALL